jgi:hypothetical protein
VIVGLDNFFLPWEYRSLSSEGEKWKRMRKVWMKKDKKFKGEMKVKE